MQSDPIGLDGGMNSFGYVESNSLKYIDIDGLVKVNLFSSSDDPVFHTRIKEYQNASSTCLVYGHGSPDHVAGMTTAASLAKRLKSGGCKSSMNVILYSCRTGFGSSPIAKKLTAYFPRVTAPTRQIWYNSNPSGYGPTWIYGKNSNGSMNKNDPGKMVAFTK